jgi:prolyl oligopeptidase
MKKFSLHLGFGGLLSIWLLNAFLIGLLSCSTSKIAGDAMNDPYLWLEDARAPRAMDWVKAHNDKSVGLLTSDPHYAETEAKIRKVVLAPDRLPIPELTHGMIYNFWQDSDHVRGIWRRTSIAKYSSEKIKWETVLDIDALARAENENWVYKGASCLEPAHRLCLIALSRGGGDAIVYREFDLRKKKFISPAEGGFEIPEAKSSASWVDEKTLLVATDWGTGSLTSSGYPRIVKKWTRGTPLAQSTQLFEGPVTDVSSSPLVSIRREATFVFVSRGPSFFTNELWLADLTTGSPLKKVEIPLDAALQVVFQKQLILKLRSEWKLNGETFPSGSLVSVSLDEVTHPKPKVILRPDAKTAIESVVATKDHLFISALENVNGRIFEAVSSPDGQWKVESLHLPDAGETSFVSSDEFDNRLITQFQSFLVPPTYYLHTGPDFKKLRPLKQAKSRFDASPYVVEQFESTSLDGTRVPYFIVHHKKMPLDGSTPTLLYGYGGFENSMTPFYVTYIGKVWLEKGGAYVLSNIRGGGEFGPAWHQSVLKENRHKAFEDFISVANDLISRKITSPKHLGIRGGSNGGLLMGATVVERPDLFNAVSCEVPLLDMIRYPQIGAGASWIEEYGDPRDPAMLEVLMKYSPYQNVKRDGKYPKIFFSTATTDDRVSPAHARKMTARMEEQGHDILFYENTDGGHGAAANLEQVIRDRALIYTYFLRQLN